LAAGGGWTAESLLIKTRADQPALGHAVNPRNAADLPKDTG
jgi:hypothetical protein